MGEAGRRSKVRRMAPVGTILVALIAVLLPVAPAGAADADPTSPKPEPTTTIADAAPTGEPTSDATEPTPTESTTTDDGSAPVEQPILAEDGTPVTAAPTAEAEVQSEQPAPLSAQAFTPTVAGPSPIPGGLWDINPAVDAGQSYVAIDGQSGDWPTAGQDFLYTKATAQLTVTAGTGHIGVSVSGSQGWTIDFQAMSGVDPVTVGYYPGLTRYPFHDAAVGGLSFFGEGRGCNEDSGWVAVDQITYTGGAIAALTLRFFQSCDGGPGAYGKIRWNASDPTEPPGPQSVPGGLWDTTPAVGAGQTYVAIDGTPGDYISAGKDQLYTLANAQITVSESTNGIAVSVSGDTWWNGSFAPMSSHPTLAPGYYPSTSRFATWAGGGVDWTGDGRGCNRSSGWMAVDELTRTGGVVATATIRFAQSCDGGPQMFGKIRWIASDTTRPPGPQIVPGGLWDTTPAVGAGQTYVAIDGTPGDYISAGQDQLLTLATARITVAESTRGLSVSVSGDTWWNGSFDTMTSQSALLAGYYTPTSRSATWATAGASWTGDGRGCNQSSGWMAVDELTRTGGVLATATIRFAQSCDGGPQMFGKIRWVASDTTSPPAPQAIPGGLWDTTPAVGAGQTYVAIDGTPGDHVSAGQDQLFTLANAQITVSDRGTGVSVDVQGDTWWNGSFGAMTSQPAMVPGYYSPTSRSATWAGGGVDWTGDGRGCNQSSGWMAVDELTRASGKLATLTIRFAQSCDGGPQMFGKIRWVASDTTQPPGPQPIPGDLWDATAAVLPGQSYVLLDGVSGDYITGGVDRTYTQATSRIRVSESNGLVQVGVTGDQDWSGSFEAMGSIASMQTGYYSPTSRYPFNSTARPGLDWTGEGRGCNQSTGWFAVDQISRVDGQLSALTLRFFQSCDGGPGTFGKIRWLASDTTTPPGPQPIPPGLWNADPGISGDYVFMDGVPGDYISQGQDSIYTPVGSTLSASESANTLTVNVSGSHWWNGHFVGMDQLSQLQVGYYPDVQRWPFGNPVKGMLDWSGDGRGCNTLTGWFAVDELIRANGQIRKLTLRFEQSCDGGPAMHGKIVIGADQPSLAPASPIGSLEYTGIGPGGVAAAGWALDPDTASPIPVVFFVDDVGYAAWADQSRPDIGAAYAGYGSAHGYAVIMPAAPGPHEVCAIAYNVGVGSDVLLGCGTVVVPPPSPFGSLDVAQPVLGGVNVAGWAIDPDTSAPVAVHVYVDGQGTALTANGPRSDLAGLFPAFGGAHGYSATIPASPGAHTVCAYGINAGPGSNSSLGCRTVVVPGGSPIGSLDVANLVPGVGVLVGGWALDPDTATSIPVHVYVDGKGVALTADGARSDIAAVFPGYGPAHGFSSTIPTGPGLHTVCAYGINTGAGANSSLGCRVVNVPTGSPIGSLDLVAGGKGYVSAGGWAADPDTAAPIAVHLYVDSAGTAVNANLNRPDVGAYFSAWGPLHGWATTVNAAPGLHNVCAYAINVGNGQNTQLGCRLVIVT